MPSTSQAPKNGRMSSSKGPRKSVYDTNFAPLGWRESRATMKFPHVNDLLFPEEQKVQKTVSAPACYQAFCLTDSKRMGANNHKVSPRIMGAEWPNLVSARQSHLGSLNDEVQITVRCLRGLPALESWQQKAVWSTKARLLLLRILQWGTQTYVVLELVRLEKVSLFSPLKCKHALAKRQIFHLI